MEEYKVKATITAWFDGQQAKQDLGKFKDDIDGFKKRLASDRGIVLASNLAELRLKVKQLWDELKRTTDPERKLDIQTNLELLKKDITDANRRLTNFARTGDEAQSVLGKNFEEIGNSVDKWASKLQAFGGLLAWLWVVAGINNLAKGILNVAASFQTYDTILTNALWSQEKAKESFKLLKEISSDTPFSLEEITKSYIKLVNRGIVPTKDEIVKLGDLASSQGKSFDQLVEAVLDAQTWEFERLKEFGVKARVSWDDVSFTFKGVTTTVKKTDEAIKDYLLSLGELNGVQWSMATQSQTFNGAVSNLWDALTNLSATIGSAFLPILTPIIRGISEVVNWFVKLSETSPVLSQAISLLAGALWALLIVFWWYIALSPFLTAANLAIAASFLPILAPIGLVVAAIAWLALAYDKNFLWFKDFVTKTVTNARVLYEFLRIVFNNIKWIFAKLSTYISTIMGDIKASFSGLSVVWSIVGRIFSNVFNVIKGYVAPILKLVESIIKAIGQIPWVQATLAKARSNIAQQKAASYGITSPAPLDLTPINQWPTIPKLDDIRTPRGWWLGGWRSKAIEDETKALEESQQKEKEIFDQKVQDTKDYIDAFSDAIKQGEQSIDNLSNKIEEAQKKIESLNEKQLTEQEKLASKYVEIQEKLSGKRTMWNDERTAQLQEDLELILQYTTEAQRAEAQRQATLSETEKIVENIQAIESEKKDLEEEVKALEAQKELETVILEEFNLRRGELEKQYTALVWTESQTRMQILQKEIEKTKELIKLQQKAGTSGMMLTKPSTTSNTNTNSTTNNVNIKVDWATNPTATGRAIATQLQNFNSWNNK